MTTFDERERAFENKFAHDAEMQFKAEGRRDRLAAEWAADLLGRDAEEYTREVIKADMQEAGFEDVVRKLLDDLKGKASESEIRAKLDECSALAKQSLLDGA